MSLADIRTYETTVELIGLFSASLLSASFFPFQSELLFIGMLAAGRHTDWILLIAASIGNTLGSTINWWLGRYVTRYENKRWFPIRKTVLIRAERWFKHWGKWSLLASWVPVIGDPLTMIAGTLRMRFLPFITLVAIAKTGRYMMIMAAM